MKKKLTKSLVNSICAGEADQIIWDAEVPGLGLRVTKAGAKSYIFKYRIGKGRQAASRKPTLGKVSDLTPDQARDLARAWKQEAKDGNDPARTRLNKAQAPTVSVLCDEYLDRHASRKRSSHQDKLKIEKWIKPKLGRYRLIDIQRRDVEDLHRSRKKTPYEANRLLALVSKMFSLAIAWGWRSDNPATGIERFPEEKREIYLTPKQLETLTLAMNEYLAQSVRASDAKRAIDAIRLLILTGARKSEVLSATWDQFNLETGVWTKPSSHTKQKKAHRAPLSDAAVEHLRSLAGGIEKPIGYVFPGKSGGHLKEVKRAWEAVREKAGLQGVRIHDLRHTFASLLVSGGLSLPVIGALLGHTQTQTTQRYAHLMDDPLREAANHVGAIVSGAKK